MKTKKTAISIPNYLFDEAEQTAKKMHISRSELYCLALEDYVSHYNSKVITEKLNEYFEHDTNELPKDVIEAQANALPEEDW